MPAVVPAGVLPPLKDAIVTVADDVAAVRGATVTVAKNDECDFIIPDDAGAVENAVDELVLLPVLSAVADAEECVVADAPLILKARLGKPSEPSACETVK